MTLQLRNACFKAGIFLAVLALIAVAGAAVVSLPVYPEAAAESIRRSAFQARYFPLAPYAPFAAAAGAVLYALVTLSLITAYFEKTRSPEILFVGLFALSLASESLRVLVPLRIQLGFPAAYLLAGSRALIFGRSFGTFSLFVAGVYAAGLEVQKQQYLVLAAGAGALVIALGVPVDTLAWDSTLTMLSGYDSLLRLVETGVCCLTLASFLAAALSQGSRELLSLGAGAFLLCVGRSLLLGADTWAAFGPALFILGVGTWFLCGQLHRMYLWL